MNTNSITTRVADLIRNPSSQMPSEWERSVQDKRSKQSAGTETATAKSDSAPAKDSKPDVSVSASGAETATLESGDKLTLSPLAKKMLVHYDTPNQNQSDWEKAREEHVQRIQQLVQSNQYQMPSTMVDTIASKIVDLLP